MFLRLPFKKTSITTSFIVSLSLLTLVACNSSSTATPPFLSDSSSVNSQESAPEVGSQESTEEVNPPSTDESTDSIEETTPEPNDPADPMEGESLDIADTLNGTRVPAQEMPESELIASDNADAVLRFALSSIRGDRVMDIVDELDQIENRVLEGDEAFTEVGFDDGRYTRIHLCPEGGRYLAGGSTEDKRWEFEFRDCGIDGSLFNGGYAYTTYNAQDVYDISGNGGAFVKIDEQGVESHLGGEIKERNTDTSRTTQASLLYLLTVDSGLAFAEHFTFTARDTYRNEDESDYAPGTQISSLGLFFDRGVRSDFYVSINGNSLSITDTAYTVNLENPFERSISSSYVDSGQLNIRPRDSIDNILIMQADNGDPDSFDRFIDNTGDSLVSVTTPWSEPYVVRGFRARMHTRLLYDGI